MLGIIKRTLSLFTSDPGASAIKEPLHINVLQEFLQELQFHKENKSKITLLPNSMSMASITAPMETAGETLVFLQKSLELIKAKGSCYELGKLYPGESTNKAYYYFIDKKGNNVNVDTYLSSTIDTMSNLAALICEVPDSEELIFVTGLISTLTESLKSCRIFY